MHHPSTLDDRLLALEVETALKALGIAATGEETSEGDLRSAVEDLRHPAPMRLRHAGTAVPPLLALDEEILSLG